MGSNFHTPYDGTESCTAIDLNEIGSDLDTAITYIKNVIIHYDGDISYSILTGVLTWTGTIYILFTREDGKSILNLIMSANITLADDEFCFVELSETHNQALSMQKAAVATEVASNFIDFNLVVLGIKNAASDRLFSKYFDTDPDKLVQALDSGDTVSVDWSLGSLVEVTLDRATTTFSFDGARDGQEVTLALLQDGTGSRGVAFGAEVRAGTDITLPLTLSGADLTDYVKFKYRDADDKYDLIGLKKGF